MENTEDDYDSYESDTDNEDNKPKPKISIKIKPSKDETAKPNDSDEEDIDDVFGNSDDEEDLDDIFGNSDDEDDDDDDDNGNTKGDDIVGLQDKNKDAENTLKPSFDIPDYDDDDSGEEDDDVEEHYLQKFDESIHQQIISQHHPELHMHNNDEIDILSRVVRDQNGTIIDPLHRTLPFMTRFEKARFLGERAKQINSGAKPMVALEPNVIDGYLIALKEYEAKKIPFIIKRPLPNGGCEYWRFSDLEII